MRFVIRGAVLVGIGYGVGYVQGIKSGVKLGHGLETFGEGLKEVATELAFTLAQTKMEQKDEEKSEEAVVDEQEPGVTVYSITHVDEDNDVAGKVRALKTEGARTSGEIADTLGISQDEVNRILDSKSSEPVTPQAS